MTPIFRDLNLDSESQRVLIIEDDRHWQRDLSQLLAGIGHEVDAFDGIARLAPSPVLATRGSCPFEIDLGAYDIAFLDYYFLGGVTNGGDLAAAISTFPQTRIVGMSSDPGANARMLAQGAHWAMRKSELRARILGQK